MNFDNTQVAFASKTNKDLKRANLLFSSMAIPWLTRIGIQATLWSLRVGIPIRGIIKQTIFNHFCGGETLQEAQQTAEALNQYGISVIMDYGVEGKSSEEEFEKAVESFLTTIRFVADKPNIPFVSLKVTGFADFNLLEKVHSGELLSTSEIQAFERVRQRIHRICKEAAEQGKMILIDAEESWIQQPVDDLADALMAEFNKKNVVVFNTFQLYRHDRLEFLKASFQKAKAEGYHLGAKLVRGAYMEKERERALAMGYSSPIQANKSDTDRDFDLGVKFCLQNLNNLHLFIGTHNEKSCLDAVAIMEQLGISKQHHSVHFSQLYGMSDNISFNLSQEGYQVSKYLPYGPVGDVIPYLMRRAQENTSVAGQTGRELSLIRKELERRKKS